jgi:uracil-DNA glycosylase
VLLAVSLCDNRNGDLGVRALSVHGFGPAPARIMIVGEAPGSDEVRAGKPFVGMSGIELDRMLHEAGILRSDCFVTNVCREQPPGNEMAVWIPSIKKDIQPNFVRFRDKMVHPFIPQGYALLQKEIALVKPTLILALGNTPLWALTGRWGITKWRGSQLVQNAADLIDQILDPPVKVIPTYHPAAILRQWDWRAISLHDLRRAKREAETATYRIPEWTFILRPSIVQALGTLGGLLERLETGPTLLSFDLETRAGHIACAGIAWSKEAAICIPFMAVGQPEGYWPLEEEVLVLDALRLALCHPNARVVGQNLLYDAQYTWRHWHFTPRVHFDTMIAHHTAFAAAAGPDETSLAKLNKQKKRQGGFKKSLDFQSSMYNAHYVYWKDDSKEWDPAIGEEQFWRYNCEDAVRTMECAEVLGVRTT